MALSDIFARLGAALFAAPTANPADEIDAALLEHAVDAVVELSIRACG